MKTANKRFLKFILELYKPIKKWVVVFILAIISTGIATYIRQITIENIINMDLSANIIEKITPSIILLILSIIFEIIFFYIANIIRCMVVFKKQSNYTLEKLLVNLNNKEYAFFTDKLSGTISSAISQIPGLLIELNKEMGDKFFKEVIAIITNLILIFSVDIVLFSITSIMVLTIIITRIMYFQKKYIPIQSDAQKESVKFNGRLNDNIMNYIVLKTNNVSTKYIDNMSDSYKKYTEYIAKGYKKEFSYGAVANILYFITLIVLFIYSIIMLDIGTISLGGLVIFITSIILLKKSTTALSWNYIRTVEKIIKIKACYDVIEYDRIPSLDKCNKPDIIFEDYSVEFKNVDFFYGENKVLSNFNLKVENRENVGIIGISGSGKTTLINLILNFYEPLSGKVLIGKSDTSKCNQKSLYNKITLVSQETILFHTSILENIRVVKPDATMEEIIDSAKKAELHEFIIGLENGYNTIVGERGIKLSGGQRQRISLARIFLKNSDIIIFDEATSSLDNTTELKIQENIHKYFKDKTIICVAHRLSTLRDMDKIVVLENGKILEEGTPQLILEKYDKKNFIRQQ